MVCICDLRDGALDEIVMWTIISILIMRNEEMIFAKRVCCAENRRKEMSDEPHTILALIGKIFLLWTG